MKTENFTVEAYGEVSPPPDDPITPGTVVITIPFEAPLSVVRQIKESAQAMVNDLTARGVAATVTSNYVER